MTFPEEDFKSATTGMLVKACKSCKKRAKLYSRLNYKGFNKKLVGVFIYTKPKNFKSEPYCMRCGKPFYSTIEEDEDGGTKIDERDEDKCIEWGYYENKRKDKFILCLDCLYDRLNDKKFNLYKYNGEKDFIGVLIQEQVCINDLTAEEYEFLYFDYPFTKLKNPITKEKKNKDDYLKSIAMALQEKTQQHNNKL